MQMQNKLVVAVQGKKAARLRDNDAVERRDKGWKAWAEKSVNEESQAYEEHELPAIQETFADLFDDPNDRQSVAKELRTLLIQSNLIQRNNFVSSDESTSDETSETPTNDDEPAVSTPTSDDEPPLKRQKVGRPARSVTPENDPWLLSSLLELAKSDTQSFAEHELALLACDSRDRRTVEDAFTTRSIPLPCDLVDSVIHMSNPKHASAKAHVNKAREEVFKSQLAKPQPGELLVDFLGQIKRINAGQRLSQSHTHQRQLNNQLTLRDPAAQVLRHVTYCYNVSLSRLPGLICAMAPYYLGRALSQEEFSSETTLRARFTRLHKIDTLFLKKDFVTHTAVFDEYDNPILWYTCDDDSKHNDDKRHGLLFSAKHFDGNPRFKFATAAAAVTADSDGNSDLNVAALREIFGNDADGLKAFYHYGGGATDNAPDAGLTTRKTFNKVMALLAPEQRIINGVVREAIQWGDTFHVGNLVVMWCSIAAFGETKHGNHKQIHHRQAIQDLWDCVSHNKGIAHVLENQIAQEFGLELILHIEAVRERQQRWMVNQQQCKHILDVYEIDCGGESFLLIFLQRLARILRSRSSYQAGTSGKRVF